MTDWQAANETEGTVSAAFYGDRISDMICRFFRYESYDQFREAWQDGWLDRYAIIDPVKGLVTEIYSVMVLNASDADDMELHLKITNPVEGKMLFDQIRKTGGPEFDKFIVESIDEIRYGNITTSDGRC